MFLKCTFKPLGKKRYRCNQTGDIVPSQLTKRYRSVFINDGLPAARNLLLVNRKSGGRQPKGKKTRGKYAKKQF